MWVNSGRLNCTAAKNRAPSLFSMKRPEKYQTDLIFMVAANELARQRAHTNEWFAFHCYMLLFLRADIPFFRTLVNSVVQQPLFSRVCIIQRQWAIERERGRAIEKCFTNLIFVLILALDIIWSHTHTQSHLLFHIFLF